MRSIALGPSFVTTSMIVLAQRNALTRLSDEKCSGLSFAYAHAIGIAVRRPGRNRLISRITFWLSLTRWTTASR